MIKLQEKATAQETFDYVVGKLREQGRPAVNDRGYCVYGEPGGFRCAIGHLMTETCPHVGNLSQLVLDNIVKEPKNESLLRGMQCAHDYAADTVDFKNWARDCAHRLNNLALAHGLDGKSAVVWEDSL